jgi:hypothetical protein
MDARPESEDAFSISRAAVYVLTGVLLLLVLVPGTFQTAGAPHAELKRFARLAERMPTSEELAAFEKDLAAESIIGTALRRRYRSFAVRSLRQGSRNVVVGGASTLVYRPDVQLVALAKLTRVSMPSPTSPRS